MTDMSSTPVRPTAAAADVEPPAAVPFSSGRASRARRMRPAGAWLSVVLVGLLIPFVVSTTVTGLLIDAAILGLFALSLGFLAGQVGMISLGHAAFYGGSAYTVAIATTGFGLDVHLAVVLALVVAVVLAVIIGAVSIRVPGIGFAMVTLGFAQLLYLFATLTSSRELTGGFDGISADAAGFLGLSRSDLTGLNFWPLVWLVTAGCVLGLWALRRSRFGVLLAAIRDNEERVRFCGFATYLPRLGAFAVSGLIAGIAGVLFVLRNAYVSPATLFWITTAFGLIAVLLGGIGTLAGPFVGALLYEVLADRFALSGQSTFFLGLAFVAVVALFPAGITGLVATWWPQLLARVRRRERPAGSPAADRDRGQR